MLKPAFSFAKRVSAAAVMSFVPLTPLSGSETPKKYSDRQKYSMGS